jgi:hypothetical protein
MTKLLTRLFIIDYVIIIFKIVNGFNTLMIFETTNNSFAKQVYFHLLFPFGIYGVINLLRLFLRQNKYLLYGELLLNFIFTFLYIYPHELIFLLSTLVSLFIVLYPVPVRKKQVGI